jgi:gamma-glutamyl hercynylcysteine S-oxide synthase
LIENEGARLSQVAERNAPKLERVRLWMKAIVTHGWLPPLDRVHAGEALSVLGDDRDFEELITIPAGPFMMGDEHDETMRPQHKVILPEFKIGRYLVTNMQYKCFATAIQREWKYSPERANHPVVRITWYQAQAYCRWLTTEWQVCGKIAANEEVRLPAEAEWEKAACGIDDRVWPWGNEWSETKCNTRELNIGTTTAVGLFPNGASPYGCLDMAGNVWEWTLSLWQLWDQKRPVAIINFNLGDGRENLKTGRGALRVLRGGSFSNDLSFARCAYRSKLGPDYTWYDGGFRIAVAAA